MGKELNDVAYDIALKQFGNKTFSFKELWTKVVSANRIKKAEADELIGEFYAEIMQDPRFVYCSNNTWKLVDFLSVNDTKNAENLLYNSVADDVYEEGYEQIKKPDESNEEQLEENQREKTEEEIAAEFGFDNEMEEAYNDMNKQMMQSEEDEEDN